MPGIYVRTLSQFDLLNQEKESLLSIPGSYWLCHKKNIYKFIFKYDRTVKNPMEFSYGRELLKIVRRIIKCHPSQGQQFGTPHLLVTYNCTSWTRQDKMFAILKFQQQTNAAAFSHAFVLTIKMYPSVKHSLFDDKYPIVKEADAGATFKDLNVTLDNEEKIAKSMMPQCVYTRDKVSPKKTAIYQNKQDQVSKYSTRTEDAFNETPETEISNFQDIVKNSDSFDESLNASIKSATTTSKVQFITTEFQNTNENESTNCSIERNMNHGDMNVNKQTLFNGFDFHKNSVENNICLLNNNDTLNDSGKTISETNPTKDPDQYFVDCESEKHDKRSSFSTLRSSNITDLVMEGLMFTICQDKDSVTVIEQKTKLNEMIDEVLENSEKVETKTGEKCLLNSSLLKLENLVTMIDSPRISSNITSSDSNLAKGTTTERSEKLMDQQNDDNQHTKKDINNIETEREKRKDIIPEVSPPILFSSEKKNTGLRNGDLLMNDTDTREASECEISVKKFYNSSLSSNPSSSSSSRKMFTKKENSVISAESDSTKLPRGQETNGPRIISDKAITMEQMSPALQKVLHTFRTRGLSRSDSKMLQYQEETQYIAEESSLSKNSSPKKLQDITEDFYYDLLHARNKDNAIRQRCLRQKQRSLNDPDKNGKVRIEILKFIQDMTEGARVVVTRLNMDNKCC